VGGLDESWNTPDECDGVHGGPYVVLEHTNQRKCLRCFYMNAFLNGLTEMTQDQDRKRERETPDAD
jgi:hypothetical protein